MFLNPKQQIPILEERVHHVKPEPRLWVKLDMASFLVINTFIFTSPSSERRASRGGGLWDLKKQSVPITSITKGTVSPSGERQFQSHYLQRHHGWWGLEAIPMAAAMGAIWDISRSKTRKSSDDGDDDFAKDPRSLGSRSQECLLSIHWTPFLVFQKQWIKGNDSYGRSVYISVEPGRFLKWKAFHLLALKTSYFTLPNNHGNYFIQWKKSCI